MSRGSEGRGMAGVVVLVSLVLTANVGADDTIVLRPKLPVRGKTVQSFDPDGVRLAGGTVLGWEEIESAVLDRDQARFDTMRTELGEPLFQVARGLRSADYRSVLEPAEQVWPTYAERRTKPAFLAALGLFWGRLEAGRREGAVEPYLVLLDIQKRARERPAAPGSRRLPIDLNSGLSPELPPIFLDRAGAETALPGARKAAERSGTPGAALLIAGLELAAGDADGAGKILDAIDAPPRDAAELRRILEARKWLLLGKPDQARAAVEGLRESGLDATRPLARWVHGEALVGSSVEAERRDGVLDLLYLPSVSNDPPLHPDLAARALDRAARTLEDLGDPESKRLRQDLRRRFPDQAARLEAGPND